jgi:hypothetical protein
VREFLSLSGISGSGGDPIEGEQEGERPPFGVGNPVSGGREGRCMSVGAKGQETPDRGLINIPKESKARRRYPLKTGETSHLIE